jgi:ribosome modulation factor
MNDLRPTGHDPHQEGATAHSAGLGRWECPYSPESGEAEAWLRGWNGDSSAASRIPLCD